MTTLIRWVVRPAFAIGLGLATYVTAVRPHKLGLIEALAFIAVAISATIQMWIALGGLLAAKRNKSRERLNKMLVGKIIFLWRQHIIDCDVTKISMHIWVVPPLYRRVFPYKLRRALTDRLSEQVVQERSWRPYLKCIAYQRYEYKAPSRVKFKKGLGMVGDCLEENLDDKVHFMNFEDAVVQGYLATEESWRAAPSTISHGLLYSKAKILADSYGQAAAIVLREPTGEAYGCITIEVPKGCRTKLSHSGVLRTEIRDFRVMIASVLSLESSDTNIVR